ncbi:hypothetical protein PPTG_11945 [Phytophthora nicotianae INRA-310]|uniref:Retrovirus-related Pol polyprotein from transposon TNT 1-94-like beta-barrel domain-containing protein n=1 Tax=Phytophthora nicotianae (strain INRA-310) TaxID=761204 RepID=W2Q8X7_PHYN3|nr:hypothetical protein PPTG_11945 [Phytophthora nicotianae INRA-310]ETN09617.1 hypothetical protein PPTG_11945 [Phytophthora nicotianae INRA-310]
MEKGRNKFHGRRIQSNDEDSDEYGVDAITTLDLRPIIEATSLTAEENAQDPMWTVDSGCTRQVSSNPTWFEELTPRTGKAITVGGNHQIPIKGTGSVKIRIKNTKGKDQRSLCIMSAMPQNCSTPCSPSVKPSEICSRSPSATPRNAFSSSPIESSSKRKLDKTLDSTSSKLARQTPNKPTRLLQDQAKTEHVKDMVLSKFDPKQD